MLARDHAAFDKHLTLIAGQDRTARLALIDRYDSLRKSYGRGAAWAWIEQEARKHKSPVWHALQVIQDDAARRIIQAAFDLQNKAKIDWLEHRLSDSMISTAAQVVGLTEEKIRAQAQTSLERRRLRARVKRSVAIINMAVGATGGKCGYSVVTPYELAMRKHQIELQQEWAQETYIYHEKTRQIIKLWDLIEKAGEGRVAEILALAKGLQDFGEKHHLTPMFFTLTCPGEMHANPVKGREHWDGTTPRQAQAWLNHHYRSAMQLLRDQNIYPAGVRTVEAQQDGTPHWHCVAWVEKGDEVAFEKAFRQVAPSWKSSVGADVRNMLLEPEKINPKTGKPCELATAISYLFVYILKSVGGLSESDGIDSELAQGIRENEAWRSTWGIRGYQFFGLPSQTSWRAFRATETPPADRLLNDAWNAARNGKGCDFIEASGGLNLKRKERPISGAIVKEIIDEFGEVQTGKFVHLVNRLNGAEVIEKLKAWELIDWERKIELEEEWAQQKEASKAANADEKNTLLTVIENHPRTPHSELLEDLIFGGAPPPDHTGEVFFAGEWFPF